MSTMQGIINPATEEEIATIEREDLLSPATTGLTIAEGKTVLEGLQKRMVAAQRETEEFIASSFGTWDADGDNPELPADGGAIDSRPSADDQHPVASGLSGPSP